MVKLALDLTMKRTDDIRPVGVTSELAAFLLEAEHTSVFEHGSMTILIKGISRSLLAQLTRQRTFSPTSASQHYQDYKDYPFTLRPNWDAEDRIKETYEKALTTTLASYVKLIELGEPPEEARQVLPNACSVNMEITFNPRALAVFLRQRLCYRNVTEMQLFSEDLLRISRHWFPELFDHVGPPCFMDGKCNQGRMSCGKNWKR
jgi:thymidylate synthase (FAD)